MPKILFSDVDRAIARFRRWYHDSKPSRDMTDTKMAKVLGIAQPNVSNKLKIKGNTQTQITLREAMLILKEMQATDEEILKLMRL